MTFVGFCRRVVLVVAMLLLLLLGLDAMARTHLYAELLGALFPWVQLVETNEVVVMAASLLCVLVPFVYMVLGSYERRLARGIVGRGKDGEEVRLAPEAIERAVARRIRDSVPEVGSIRRCVASQGSAGPRIAVDLAVGEGRTAAEIRNDAMKAASSTFEDILGISSTAGIRIKITDLARSKAAPRQRRRPKARQE